MSTQLIVGCVAAVASGPFDVPQTDLELLAVFQALMAERHMGRSAARLSLSPSAAQHALGRLRDVCGDPLFVRDARGVVPTPLALALAPCIERILKRARPMHVREAEFDATTAHTFVLTTSDLGMFTILVPLMNRLHLTASEIHLRVISVPSRRVISFFDRREIDLALMGMPNPPGRLARVPLIADRIVAIARRGHPALAAGALTPHVYAALPQLVVSALGEASDESDACLAELGLKRHVVMTVPDLMIAPHLVATTDLVALVSERTARRLATALDLAILELPFSMGSASLDMLTSAARVNEPPLRWLREQILDVCRDGLWL